MSLRKFFLGGVLALVALLAVGVLGSPRDASAATLLDHGGSSVVNCVGSCSVANQARVSSVPRAASPILAWCCAFNQFNQFNPFFSSFRFFNPFMRSSNFFPFFRPFSSFFPFFRLFSRSQTVNCIQIMRMPGGQTITIRVC